MRRFVLLSSLALVALAAVYSAPQSKSKASKAGVSAPAGYGNADAITEEELKAYLYFLASDQLEGRNLPSRGYDTAALYVASHLAEWGLKPGGSTEGTDGPLQPYFMPMELASKSVNAEETKASITTPAGRGGRGGGRGNGAGGGARGAAAGPMQLEYGKDWTVAAGGRGAPPVQPLDVTGSLVFAGNGYVINKTKVNPYDGIDVKGKIIVVAGLPAEIAAQAAAAAAGRGGRRRRAAPKRRRRRVAAIDAAPNPLGETCKDFLTPQEYGAKNGALAVVTIANFQQLTAMSNPNAAFGGFGGFGGAAAARRGLNGPTYTVPKLQANAGVPRRPDGDGGTRDGECDFPGRARACVADLLRGRREREAGLVRARTRRRS